MYVKFLKKFGTDASDYSWMQIAFGKNAYNTIVHHNNRILSHLKQERDGQDYNTEFQAWH